MVDGNWWSAVRARMVGCAVVVGYATGSALGWRVGVGMALVYYALTVVAYNMGTLAGVYRAVHEHQVVRVQLRGLNRARRKAAARGWADVEKRLAGQARETAGRLLEIEKSTIQKEIDDGLDDTTYLTR